MKKYILSILFAMMLLPTTAQETYENTKLVENNLNGTARYVGMGGALDALGADISVIGTNPAGLGLITKSRVDISFGMVAQQDAKAFRYGNAKHPSFDQVGFVLAMRNNSGYGRGFNFAINYHKSRNFNYILSAEGALKGASQNTLSFLKAINGPREDKKPSNFYLDKTKSGNIVGTNKYTSQLDNLYYNNLLVGSDNSVAYSSATAYLMNRANTGYIGTYDLNMSGAVTEHFYLGATVGFHDVHYSGISEYTEDIINAADKPVGTVTVNDERTITGLGVDFKFGALFFPINNSPFRLGFSIATPTYYNLTTSNSTTLHNSTPFKGINPQFSSSESYRYRVVTPWKFGISLGHTMGKYLALGASYDYADYATMKTKVNEGSTYDWYTDSYYETSSNDVNMNRHTQQTLRGVSTFKLGAECRPTNAFSLRAGYNYVSPMYKMNGYKDGTIDSYGSNYSTATDFVNWKSIQRYTLGVGYHVGKFNIDLAYQCSEQKGDFHPFMDAYGDYYYENKQTNSLEKQEINNYADAVSVLNKRHQLLVTFGYRW